MGTQAGHAMTDEFFASAVDARQADAEAVFTLLELDPGHGVWSLAGRVISDRDGAPAALPGMRVKFQANGRTVIDYVDMDDTLRRVSFSEGTTHGTIADVARVLAR